MMQTGFAMLCAGSVRQKNVKNIMLKNLLDACGGALGFWLIGYGLAYGDVTEATTTFVGTSYFAFSGFDYANLHNWFFQFAFAASAATIVAGTVAERCAMSAYLCYSFFLTSFVYPVIVHSIWNAKGFLSAFNANPVLGVGVIDFAGSGVVHLTGGTTALVAAIILGPRKGRFYDEDGNPLEEPTVFAPHSVALQVLGTFILWFGWYGFNPGSTLLITPAGLPATAALCAVTTTIGGASGCISGMFTDCLLEARKSGEVSYDLTMAMNGALSGLVAVTAGCSVIDPWAAMLIGIVAGWCYIAMSKLLIKLRIDDAVDAVPVHFANGLWGLFAVGLFARIDLMATAAYGNPGGHQGWFFNGSDLSLLACQISAMLWIVCWVTVVMVPFFVILNMLNMFRVDPLEEEVGLDISHHRGSAYDLAEPNKEHIEELKEIRASKHGKVEVPSEEEEVDA
jgi:ammonium transporter, Amt family